MAEPAEVRREAVVARVRAVEAAQVGEGPCTARSQESGEQWVARLLRGGALASGGLFLASVGLELLPAFELRQVLGEGLRRAAALVLLATPVLRLVVAGAALGLRGEWRYTLYAAGVLALLALAVVAGLRT